VSSGMLQSVVMSVAPEVSCDRHVFSYAVDILDCTRFFETSGITLVTRNVAI